MSAVIKPAPELFPRRWFLCTDAKGYETIKHTPEQVGGFVGLWTQKYPNCLPITVVELQEVQS